MLIIYYCGGVGLVVIAWNYHRMPALYMFSVADPGLRGLVRAIYLLTWYVNKIVPNLVVHRIIICILY